jgi:hypothetical protein
MCVCAHQYNYNQPFENKSTTTPNMSHILNILYLRQQAIIIIRWCGNQNELSKNKAISILLYPTVSTQLSIR